MKATQRISPSPVVSIIIPVFNKAGLTMQCLANLPRVTGHIPHEIIIVDNASTDETPRLLLNRPPNVRVIRNEANRGFACACNQGAESAVGKYLLFLNNDTIPMAGWLDPLLDEMRQHSDVAAVGAKLIYASGLVQHAGVVFDRETRNPYHPYRLLRADHPRVNHRRELQAVTAACVLIRPKWFHECEKFCEDYRNGYEDLDLCLKIRRRGGVIVYQPKSVVIHLESQTPGRMQHDNENRALFFERWSDTVLSDEDAFYFSDGYRILDRRDQRLEGPRLLRLDLESERKQWSTVAQSQLLAAERRPDALRELLADANNWPQHAAVRRWAGVLCLRMQDKESAARHFQAALLLKDDPELRVILEAAGTGSETNQAVGPMDWEPRLKAAYQLLRQGDSAAAQEALEEALLLGAPPRLVLPALGQTASQNGTAAEAELVRKALLGFPPTQSDATLRLAVRPPTSTLLAGPSRPCQPAQPVTPLVSVIILALNQLEHSRKCLESLAACTTLPHEVILVDNGSNDGTPAFFEQWKDTHPNCTIIRNSSNRGFAAGNNQGLSLARGGHVVLLNNDTVVTDGWLEGILKVFKLHPRTGIVGPMSNNVSGIQRVAEPGYADLSKMPAFAAQWSRDHQGQSLEVNRAVGFCLVASRTVIDRVGGLDEQFGSGNFEDDDLCIRARLAGFGVRIAQDVFIHHTGSQTFKGARIDYRQAMLRNWELFRQKWQLSGESSLEHGYHFPRSLPKGVQFQVSLPNLELTHKQDGEKKWSEGNSAPLPFKSPVVVPAVAGIGDLDKARAHFKSHDLQAAWKAASATLTLRPFHPEAYQLLANVALAVGDSQTARQCAQYASELAPSWKLGKQFLQKATTGKTRPDWLVLPESVLNQPPRSQSYVPRLSVCVIAKDEAKFLPACLRSVKGVAHQIVVVDTGSTDRTIEIAKELGAEVYSFPWRDDFSAARNAALEHARGDWVLVLDADEELTPDQHERLLADLRNRKNIALRLPLVNAGQEAEGRSCVPRLFRNAPGIYYTGRIHEQVFPSLIALGKAWGLGTGIGSAQILHHGYTKDTVKDRNKVERNLNLLRQAIKECPQDPNLTMNLGLELVRSGDLQGGLPYYRQAFELMSGKASDELGPELREALLTQFTSHLYKARAHAEVVDVLTSPLANRGGLTASLHFALGLAFFELQHYEQAVEHFRKCLSKRQQSALTPINTDIKTAAPYHCLAMSLAKLGEVTAAEKAFQTGASEKSRVEELKLDYAKFLVDQNRPVDALQCLHEVVAGNVHSAAAWRLGGQIALGRPEFFEVASDWTAEARNQAPDDITIISQRAEVLLLSRQTVQARELWEDLVKREQQPRAQAALILCDLLEDGSCAGAQVCEPELGPVSRAMIDWYQRCIAVRAQPIVNRVNEQLDILRSILPAAAYMIEAALAEAGDGTTVEDAEPCLA